MTKQFQLDGASELQYDGVTTVLVKQITEGVNKINEANKIFLAEDTGTSVKEIDKALRAPETELPENIREAWNAAEEALKIYKSNADAARNFYRVDVLGEEPKEDKSDDTDKEAVKEVRATVMNGLSFLQSYAHQNNMQDFLAWIKTVAVPQVGRAGASVTGVKKPRVNVRVDGTLYNSFSEAAVALSDKDNKFTAGNLAEAWNAAGGDDEEFVFSVGEVEHVLTVTDKPKNK